MVAVTLSWATDPVATAHAALRAKGDVGAALSEAEIPNDLPDAASSDAIPGTWAKYVGMIQDIWDAELFVASSPNGSALLVEDCVVSPEGVTLSERLPFYLVSIPGASDWIQPKPASAASASNTVGQTEAPQRSKRGRDEMDVEPNTQTQSVQNGTTSASTRPLPRRASYRARPPRMPQPVVTTGASAATSSGSGSVAAPAPASSGPDKRMRSVPAIEFAETAFVGLGMNHPVAARGTTAVLGKLYDRAASGALKVNSVVEVVGVVQKPIRPSRDDSADAHDAAFVEEVIARNPMVPRLHVVRLRVLEPWELNPSIRAACATRGMPSLRAELLGVLPTMRDVLLKMLASALGDDMFAAEYLLFALLARPSTRTSSGALLGKLSVNIVLPNDMDASRISACIRALCPSVVPITISIAALNSRELYPRKDYTANRLRAAPLQVPAGGVLLGDETNLSDGRLAERGVKNLRALRVVAQRAMVPADFQYYENELPVDCGCVILSRGGKSLVPTDALVKVVPNKEAGLVPWERADEDLLSKARAAIAALIEHGEFNMADDVGGAVETAFVEARRQGSAKDGQEVLGRWLSVARIAARSFGESTLTKSRWEYAFAMENARESRLAEK